MKCASCHRLLLKAAATVGRASFGPVCARKMQIPATKSRAFRAGQTRAKQGYFEENQMDLFEGITQ